MSMAVAQCLSGTSVQFTGFVRPLVASGITVKDNNLIARHVRRWKFSCPTERDRNLLSAVQAAALFLKKHPECIRDNLASRDEIQLAVIAIKVYDVFLDNNIATANFAQTTCNSEIVKKVLMSYKMFEKRAA